MKEIPVKDRALLDSAMDGRTKTVMLSFVALLGFLALTAWFSQGISEVNSPLSVHLLGSAP